MLIASILILLISFFSLLCSILMRLLRRNSMAALEFYVNAGGEEQNMKAIGSPQSSVEKDKDKDVVASRQGNVLGPFSILKEDNFPGMKSGKVEQIIEGESESELDTEEEGESDSDADDDEDDDKPATPAAAPAKGAKGKAGAKAAAPAPAGPKPGVPVQTTVEDERRKLAESMMSNKKHKMYQ